MATPKAQATINLQESSFNQTAILWIKVDCVRMMVTTTLLSCWLVAPLLGSWLVGHTWSPGIAGLMCPKVSCVLPCNPVSSSYKPLACDLSLCTCVKCVQSRTLWDQGQAWPYLSIVSLPLIWCPHLPNCCRRKLLIRHCALLPQVSLSQWIDSGVQAPTTKDRPDLSLCLSISCPAVTAAHRLALLKCQNFTDNTRGARERGTLGESL